MLHAHAANLSHPAAVASPRLADVSATRSTLISPVVVAGAARLLEAGLIALAGVIVAMAYVSGGPGDLTRYVVASVTAGLATSAILSRLGLYSIGAMCNPMRSIAGLLGCWSMAAGAIAAAVFFMGSSGTRVGDFA